MRARVDRSGKRKRPPSFLAPSAAADQWAAGGSARVSLEPTPHRVSGTVLHECCPRPLASTGLSPCPLSPGPCLPFGQQARLPPPSVDSVSGVRQEAQGGVTAAEEGGPCQRLECRSVSGQRPLLHGRHPRVMWCWASFSTEAASCTSNQRGALTWSQGCRVVGPRGPATRCHCESAVCACRYAAPTLPIPSSWGLSHGAGCLGRPSGQQAELVTGWGPQLVLGQLTPDVAWRGCWCGTRYAREPSQAALPPASLP